MVEIDALSAGLRSVEAELLAVGVFKGEDAPEEIRELAGDAISSGDFSGREGETLLIYSRGAISAPRLLLVGLGERARFDRERLRRASATAAKKARSLKRESAAFALAVPEGEGTEDAAQAAAEGAALGLYRFDRYKTKEDDEPAELASFTLVADDAGAANRGAEIGVKVAAGAMLARDLANEPGNVATPTYLAERAQEIAGRYGMQTTVLDRAGAAEEGLSGLLAVARGSEEEPRFIVLEHRRGGESAPVVLVGKAVTFDSGGISLKPHSGMEEMKYDMGGGAAVLGAMEAVGALGLPLNVVAIVPATENLPSGKAYKPGDVIRLHSGKTAEIVSTDAEGRMILADALSYARRYEPAAVVDCATLTGACMVALGHHASGLMGNDEDLIAEVQTAGEKSGERAWPLPLFEEYTEQIRGNTADIKNSGGRFGGALTAGAFLKEFADYPWAHLDIAGTAWLEERARNAYTPRGATGTPARLLVELLRGRAA
ncbi:leucyl aminopeptidase [Rubrobacter taiwanensis]|jgi:leucyl aminopeptidase|uniref:Probable cytosol aminopeptidase n=1 Tax=Rubrobacter taiwanensis TaxID=185139 RepID=A0A4R1BJ88_9ACTN|nr:leucyl aminopeptidase [Rubrobacter taiwanensis]TCJ17376.1 leucyl aminopeptidase [Rubrobacter taiwanensis]